MMKVCLSDVSVVIRLPPSGLPAVVVLSLQLESSWRHPCIYALMKWTEAYLGLCSWNEWIPTRTLEISSGELRCHTSKRVLKAHGYWHKLDIASSFSLISVDFCLLPPLPAFKEGAAVLRCFSKEIIGSRRKMFPAPHPTYRVPQKLSKSRSSTSHTGFASQGQGGT